MDILGQIKALVNSVLQACGFIAGDLSQQRWMVINITVPNPTSANTLVEQSITLDRDYNKVVGIGFFELQGGGLSGNYMVGARSNRKDWIDDISYDAWNAESGVAPRQKYYPVNIPYGSGDTFFARVTPLANTSAAFTAQMVLILQRDFTEMPK